MGLRVLIGTIISHWPCHVAFVSQVPGLLSVDVYCSLYTALLATEKVKLLLNTALMIVRNSFIFLKQLCRREIVCASFFWGFRGTVLCV